MRESTGHRWIPLTKASDAELWCFLWSTPEKNGWANNREAGDLRCHCANYDITVMRISIHRQRYGAPRMASIDNARIIAMPEVWLKILVMIDKIGDVAQLVLIIKHWLIGNFLKLINRFFISFNNMTLLLAVIFGWGMDCRLYINEPLSENKPTRCQLHPVKQTTVEFETICIKKMHWKYGLKMLIILFGLDEFCITYPGRYL